MLELLEWGKKRGEEATDPESDPKAAAPSIAALGDAEPSTALGELAARLEAYGSGAAPNEALALIQDAGAPHVAAMLARCFAGSAGTPGPGGGIWEYLAGEPS